MATILIVIHLIIVIALCGIVLIQRSEGGGLGIGGGSGFMSARGTANTLTRTTAILAVLFFATSLGLSLFARYGERPTDILDQIPQQSGPAQDGGNLLDQLGGGLSGETDGSEAPATQTGIPAGDDGSASGQSDAVPAPAEPAAPASNEPAVPSGG